MKIGILTFHSSRNYGAVLQAYGLKEVLENMGHKVEMVDYHNPHIEKMKHPFSFSCFKVSPVRYVQRLLSSYINYRRKVRNFTAFGNKHLNVTTHCYSPKDIKRSDYDFLIVGSDQVWNPFLTGGPDPIYWGKYKPDNARLITYAASSGKTEMLEGTQFKDVGKWLENFDAISVREERLKWFVESHSNKKASVVVDPTILAGKSPFERIALPRIIKQPYILVYSVEGTKRILPIVKAAAKLNNAKMIRIGSNGLSTMYEDIRNGITYRNASVEEMLSLIKYAECVIALSFHGTALSLLFEKDFYSVKGDNMARVESVLSKCGLEDRIISSPSELTLSHVDYSIVRPILTQMSDTSKEWLRTSLNDKK